MDIEFLRQRKADTISVLDRIELTNCPDERLNGQYTVGDVEPDTGDITLVGVGRKAGVVTVISMDETEGA